MNSALEAFVYSPGNLLGPGLLIAAADAGGIGVVDLNETSPSIWGDLGQNLHLLQKYYKPSKRLGFRVALPYLNALLELPEFPKGHEVFFIIPGIHEIEDLQQLDQFQQHSFYIEAYAIQELKLMEKFCREASIDISGFIAIAAESGGCTGKDSSFLWLQELSKFRSYPIYLRGGVGIHTIGAMWLSGIQGYVLDDQVLLFPGSPLQASQKEMLERLEGRESEVFIAGNASYRILPLPWAKAAQRSILAYQAAAKKAHPENIKIWESQTKETLCWGDPETSIWPVGQMAGRASFYSEHYGTLQQFLLALHDMAFSSVANAAATNAMAKGAPLALEHQTEFPIVQGPMTRVSDSPAFALEVSNAGALPFIALALLKEENLQQLLSDTSLALGDRSWGVGVLGFVPPELREEQFQAIVKIKPPFAIVAGGRPDHAQMLEKAGIKTYLHVPVPELLRHFIRQGIKRFIFEGRECGGHVGPYFAFPLWEQMVATLLEEIPVDQRGHYSILFAGGIHDALSSAIVSVIASALSATGMRTGVLMGTAYLTCTETVTTGAITPAFQECVINCTETTLLVSGPGHANRCVVSPFSEEFNRQRRSLLKQNNAPEEISKTLDNLLLGRLRIASKGLKYVDQGDKINVSDKVIKEEGMFMAGALAALVSKKQKIRELHYEVAEKACSLLQSSIETTILEIEKKTAPVDIAIIGISLTVPGGENVEVFWETILKKTKHLQEVPADRWDWKVLFDENPAAEDKMYSRWGGFIKDVLFDPIKYGIPPKSVPNIATCQLLALETVNWALNDAGLNTATMDRENTSVIFATSDSGGYLSNSLVVRTYIPFFTDEEAKKEVRQRTQGWTEETFPGILGNVVSGRVANRLDFGGRNYAVDAACASSLLAVDLAVRELSSRRSNIVIAGGIDVGQTPFGYLAFSKTGALSASGESRPFEKGANGIVISEGGAVLIMKRLDDAVRDGNKIYSVIKGISGSSDGRAMGLTAPRSQGQQLALVRAYEEAGFPPRTIGFYEGHGTGTSVGDSEEINTISNTLIMDGATPGSVALGSVKALVGHTKMAAGMVSLAKASLALYYKVLPPQPVKNPLDVAVRDDSPLFFYTEAVPWLKPANHLRRVGVSAFGFGGANFHAVLEEHESYANFFKNGADRWPAELLVIGADSKKDLIVELQQIHAQFSTKLEFELKDFAWSMAKKYSKKDWKSRLSIVVQHAEQLENLLDQSIRLLEGNNHKPPVGIYYNLDASPDQKVAFLFSGQGSQYLNMGREMTLYFPEFRNNLELANSIFASEFKGRFSNYLFPPAVFDKALLRSQESALNDTHVAQPAIGLISTSFLDVFNRLGLKSDFLAGHSFGELAALHAAGAFSREDFLRFSEFRGRVMAESDSGTGTMAAVMAPRTIIEEFIQNTKLQVVVANHNGPNQVVISGATNAVVKAIDKLTAADIKCMLLPVSAAFHSPMIESARKPLSDFMDRLAWNELKLPVFSNLTGKPYPKSIAAARKMLKSHLLRPVEFVAQIKGMYEAGVRVFIEIGPGRVLTGMVEKILEGSPNLALSTESSNSGVVDFLSVIGRLWAEGVPIQMDNLFSDRNVRSLPLNKLIETCGEAPLKPTSWWLNGHIAKPVNPDFGAHIPKSLLTAEDNLNHVQLMNNENPIPTGAPMATVQSSSGAHPQVQANLSGDPTMMAYFAYQETMRQFLRAQEQIMRMFLGAEGVGVVDVRNQFGMQQIPPIGQIPPQAPIPSPVIPPKAAVEAPPVQSATVQPATTAAVNMSNGQPTKTASISSVEEIQKVLVALISEKTGYPEDMIALDLDLEADLGVDSIKRLEIFQRFSSYLPEEKILELNFNADQFVRIKKLNDLIEKLSIELVLPKNIEGPKTPSKV